MINLRFILARRLVALINPHSRVAEDKYEMFLMYLLRLLGKGDNRRRLKIVLRTDEGNDNMLEAISTHPKFSDLVYYHENGWVISLLHKVVSAFNNTLGRFFGSQELARERSNLHLHHIKYEMKYVDYLWGSESEEGDIGYGQEFFLLPSVFDEMVPDGYKMLVQRTEDLSMKYVLHFISVT